MCLGCARPAASRGPAVLATDVSHAAGVSPLICVQGEAVLDGVCSCPLVTMDDLNAKGVLPVPAVVRGPIRPSGQGGQTVM